MNEVDLVLVTVGGVQRFVAESRKTVDAAGASLAIRELIMAGASAVREVGARQLIVPTPAALDDPDPLIGVTNRIAFLASAGTGPGLARIAAAAIRGTWDGLVRKAFRSNPVPSTAGMPDMAWVCVTGDEDSFEVLWARAQEGMGQRRRSRVFEPGQWNNTALCAQSAAVPAARVPKHAPASESGERFSAAGWTKRKLGRGSGRFPSTTVIASAVFRARLLAAAAGDTTVADKLASLVRDLHEATMSLYGGDVRAVQHPGLFGVDVPAELEVLSTRLGTQVSVDAWEGDALRAEGLEVDEVARRRGRKLAHEIGELAARRGIPDLTPYFAIVIQDLDRLGTKLSGLSRSEQVSASNMLTDIGREQLSISRRPAYLGVPIYAGGDDFVAFAPAATALKLAEAVRVSARDALRGGLLAGVTASTAIVFAHMTSPLQQSIATAQEALKRAKDAVGGGVTRDALTVVVLRRGGERARTIQPWRVDSGEPNAARLLELVVPDAAALSLSARLSAGLERDRDEFDTLVKEGHTAMLREEMTRLVGRHGGSAAVADAFAELGARERVRSVDFDASPASLVGRFLAGECR